MFTLMLEFQIWAESRPQHEHAVHLDHIGDEISAVEMREIEQGMSFLSRLISFLGMLAQHASFSIYELTLQSFIFSIEHARLSLVSFVASVRQALAALTNF